MPAEDQTVWAQALVDYVALAQSGAPELHRAWVTDIGSALVRQLSEGDIELQALREFIYRTEVTLSLDDVLKAEPLLRVLRGGQ